MKNLKVERLIKVNINLTAKQWELYYNSMNCSKAARTLNAAIETAINSGLNRREVQCRAHQAMDALMKFGAYDSEPRRLLQDLLDEVFGLESEFLNVSR